MDQGNNQQQMQQNTVALGNQQTVSQQLQPIQGNDTAQDQLQQTQPDIQASQVVQPTAQPTPVAQQLQTPSQIQHISGPVKEYAPISQPAIQEVVRPAEPEPVLSPEVKEAGVTTVPDQEHIKVAPELKAAGVEPVKTAVSVQTTPSDSIKLPMDEVQAEQVIKTHPIADSVRWFAMLVLEQAKKMHQNLLR